MKETVIRNKELLKRLAIGGVIGIIALIFFSVRANYKYLHYQFNGVIDSIRYGDKDTPCVIIKGKEYLLDESEWDHIIAKGDSMIKQDNSRIIKLVKPNGLTLVKGGDK